MKFVYVYTHLLDSIYLQIFAVVQVSHCRYQVVSLRAAEIPVLDLKISSLSVCQ